MVTCGDFYEFAAFYGDSINGHFGFATSKRTFYEFAVFYGDSINGHFGFATFKQTFFTNLPLFMETR